MLDGLVANCESGIARVGMRMIGRHHKVLVVALPKHATNDRPPLVLDRESAIALFDAQARRVAGVSGDEFLARWDAGDYHDLDDTPEGRELSYLVLLIPFGRRDS